MNSTTRCTSLLLAALLAASLVTACGSDTAKPTETQAATGTAATEAVTPDPYDPASVKDSLPDNLDFGAKTFRIYNANTSHQIYYEESEELAGDVYLVFSNFEEAGSYMGGAVTAAYGIDPDYAMVADVTHAVMPGDSNKEPKMGEGVSITLSPITNRKLCKMLETEAEKAGFKVIPGSKGKIQTLRSALYTGADLPFGAKRAKKVDLWQIICYNTSAEYLFTIQIGVKYG